MTRTVYTGNRTAEGCAVVVWENGTPSLLPLLLDLCSHSPTGFEWGYGGSGPAQLAFCLLCDALDSRRLALEMHQEYKAEVTCKLARESWSLTRDEVLGWVERTRTKKSEARRILRAQPGTHREEGAK